MIKESYNSPKFSPKNCTRLCFMLYQNLTITSASAGKLLKMKKKKLNTYIVFKSTIILCTCMQTLVRSITPTDVIKMATNKWAN